MSANTRPSRLDKFDTGTTIVHSSGTSEVPPVFSRICYAQSLID
jgi:hypothetical protein